jgi:hypothetical protein
MLYGTAKFFKFQEYTDNTQVRKQYHSKIIVYLMLVYNKNFIASNQIKSINNNKNIHLKQ